MKGPAEIGQRANFVYWTTLGVVMAAAIALRWQRGHELPVDFDGCGYIMHAWSMARGGLTTPYWTAGVDHYYPPLYPFLIFLGHFITGSYALAAGWVNYLFGGLLVLPVASLARRQGNNQAALFSAALVIFFPLLVKTSVLRLSEALCVFLVALAMYGGWVGATRRQGRYLFLAGFGLGLAYLARGQALFELFALLLFTGYYGAARRVRPLAAASWAALVLVGFCVWALPYEYYSYRRNQVWQLRSKAEFFKKGYDVYHGPNYYLHERSLNETADRLAYFDRARRGSMFGFIRSNPKKYCLMVGLDLVRVGYYGILHGAMTPWPILPLAAVAVVRTVKRRSEKKELDFFVYLCFWALVPLGLLSATAMINARYFILAVPSVLICSGQALEFLRQKLSAAIGKGRPAFDKITFAAGLALCLPFFPQLSLLSLPSSNNRQVEMECSRWVVQVTHGARQKILMSTNPMIALETGNYWYLLPFESSERVANYARASQADYLLVDDLPVSCSLPGSEKWRDLLQPSDKPGLKYLSQHQFDIQDEKGKVQIRAVLYQVDKR